MRLDLAHNSSLVALSITPDGDGHIIRLPDGSERRITACRLPNGMLLMTDADRVFRVAVAKVGAETHVSYEGQLYVFDPPAAEGGPSPARKLTGDLTAPMSGVVADVLVQPGDDVAAYTAIAVVEAMKVMATVEAPFAGRVREVLVSKGQRVAQGERLAEIEPKERVDA